MISEESYLKDQSGSHPKPQKLGPPTVVKAKPLYTLPQKKPVEEQPRKKSAERVEPIKPKIERIRDGMADDYDNDGFDSYGGSLKASQQLAHQRAQ